MNEPKPLYAIPWQWWWHRYHEGKSEADAARAVLELVYAEVYNWLDGQYRDEPVPSLNPTIKRQMDIAYHYAYSGRKDDPEPTKQKPQQLTLF